MKAVKSILKKYEVEVAERKRACRNSGRDITRGETCIVVFDGPRQRYCYSREVALRMIEEARTELNGIVLRLK